MKNHLNFKVGMAVGVIVTGSELMTSASTLTKIPQAQVAATPPPNICGAVMSGYTFSLLKELTDQHQREQRKKQIEALSLQTTPSIHSKTDGWKALIGMFDDDPILKEKAEKVSDAGRRIRKSG